MTKERMTKEIRSTNVECPNASSLNTAARRVIERCAELANCTQRPGEITRVFCSSAMHEAHDKLHRWMKDAGLRCRLDAAGNLIGRLDPRLPDDESQRRILLVGSHLDTSSTLANTMAFWG